MKSEIESSPLETPVAQSLGAEAESFPTVVADANGSGNPHETGADVSQSPALPSLSEAMTYWAIARS